MKTIGLAVLTFLVPIFASSCNDSSTCSAVSSTQTTVGEEKPLRSGTYRELAQSFTPSSDLAASFIRLKLKRTGSLSDVETLTASIQSSQTPGSTAVCTVSSCPSGTVVTNATASLYTESVTSTSGEFIRFSFSSSASLTASTLYWIVLTGTFAINATDYVEWMAFDDQDTDVYSSGRGLYRSTADGPWSSDTFGSLLDFAFQIGC